MRQARLTRFLDREVEVRELTAAQVINLLRQCDQAEPLSVDLLLDLPGAGDMLRAATGLTVDELEAARPSELEDLLKEVQAVNPHWAGAVKRIREEMERIRALLPTGLSGPSAG